MLPLAWSVFAGMLYLPSLTHSDKRALRHLWRQGSAALARRAQIVLLSAQGWSVPALSRLLGCCRRTVRRWIHAFVGQGLAGLLGKALGRPSRPKASARAVSAKRCEASKQSSPLVPVIALTVPEIRRLLAHLAPLPTPPVEFVLRWSVFRRYKQALAMRCHYKKRGADPPEFQQMRL